MTLTLDRIPLEELHERGDALATRFGPDTLLKAGDDVVGLYVLLMEQPRLRRTLSNPGAPEDLKVQLLRDLVADKMSPAGLELCENLVRRHWRTPVQMLDSVEVAAAWLFLLVARDRDQLDQVEDELFRIWRLLVADSAMTQALDDQAVPVERRQAMIESLLTDRVGEVTLRLVTMSLSRTGGTMFLPNLEGALSLAAEVKTRSIAYVTAAAPLTEQEIDDLADSIARKTGSDVDVKVTVDPSILGGVIVRVGDRLMDGSVARRLRDAERQLGLAE